LSGRINTNVKNAPIKEEMENFWNEDYGEKIQCNEEGYWIKTLPTILKYGMEPSIWKKATTALRKKLNWRAPSRNQAANFWLQ